MKLIKRQDYFKDLLYIWDIFNFLNKIVSLTTQKKHQNDRLEKHLCLKDRFPKKVELFTVQDNGRTSI